MTNPIDHLMAQFDPRIRSDRHSDRHRGFDDLLLAIRENINQFTLAEIVERQTAVRMYGEMDIELSGDASVNFADSFIDRGFLMEGDEHFLGTIVWRVVILSDLGLCDVNQVVDFFSNFRAWLTRLPKSQQRVVDRILVEDELEVRIKEF